MLQRSPRLGACFVAAGLLLGWISPSRARAAVKTVSVFDFAGPGGLNVSAQIEAGLADLYESIDAGVYRTAAQQMNRTGASPGDVSAVASRQHIDAIVAGLVKAGKGGALRIAVRDGASGEVIARLQYPMPRDGLTDELRGRIIADLVRAFEKVRGVTGGQRQSVARSRAAPPTEEDDDAPDQPRRSPEPTREESGDQEANADEKARSGESGDESASGEGATDEDKPTREESMVVRRGPISRPGFGVEVGAGFGLLVRSLDLHTPGATPYQGGAVPTLRFDGAVFPFGWTPAMRARHPALSTFGLAMSWVEALPFKSWSPNNVLIPGSARRWSIALVSRIPTGSDRRPVINIATGGGAMDYASEDPVALGVPNVSYRYLSLALSIDIPLGSPKAVLGLGATIFGLVAAGDIALITEYGGGSGFGGDGGVSLTVRPLKWMWLRAGVRYTGVSLSFGGGGARVSPGALDSTFDGAFEVGFVG